MSLKDLENAGITIPRDRWGKQTPRSAVNGLVFLSCAAGTIGGAVLMYIGQGTLTTWWGATLFFASYASAAVVSYRAVTSQR